MFHSVATNLNMRPQENQSFYEVATHIERMPRTVTANSKKKKRTTSFRFGEAGKLKIRTLLHDIDEARAYGIALRNEISLNKLYSYLPDAREQKKKHDKDVER